MSSSGGTSIGSSSINMSIKKEFPQGFHTSLSTVFACYSRLPTPLKTQTLGYNPKVSAWYSLHQLSHTYSYTKASDTQHWERR